MLLSGPSRVISDLSVVDGVPNDAAWWAVPRRFYARPDSMDVLNLFVKWQDTPLAVCLLADTLLKPDETISAVRAACDPDGLVISAVEFAPRSVAFRFGESAAADTRYIVYCELQLSSGDVQVVTFAVHVREGSEHGFSDTAPPPTLSVSDGVLGTTGGDRTATLTVTLSAASAGVVSVSFATADMTATDPADYTAAAGTVTFAAGETSKTIIVDVRDDGVPEQRKFRVDLVHPTGALIADGYGIVVIPPEAATIVPTLSVSPAVLTVEDGERFAVFTLSLSESTTVTVSASFTTVADTAVAGSDFTALSGTATFPPGETTKTVSVSVRTYDEESEEHFLLRLLGATGASVFIRDGVATLPAEVVQLPALSVSDGVLTTGAGTRTATFTISLSEASDTAVTVLAQTFPGTATPPGDYTHTSVTLTFSPGQTTKTVTVAVRAADYAFEEFFTLRLTDAVGATMADATGVATIPAVEVAVPVVPDVSISDGVLSVVDDNRRATLTVTLSEETTAVTTVKFTTAAGTAIAPADYTTTSGTLTFAAGETTKTIVVDVRDTDSPYVETFTVRLLSPSGLNIVNATGAVELPAVEISVPEASISNGVLSVVSGNRRATLTVTLSEETTVEATVNFATVAGTATAPADYTTTSGTLTFAAGETTKTIVVDVRDTDQSSAEAFTVVLSSPSGMTIADASGTVTLPAVSLPALSVADATLVVSGGSRSASFVVTLSAATTGAVTVAYSTADGTATAPDDYTTTSGTLTFAAGETTKTIAAPVRSEDAAVAETFTLVLSGAAGATIADGTGVATLPADVVIVPVISIGSITI